MKLKRNLFVLLSAACLALVTSCADEGPAEETGEWMDERGREMHEGAQELGEDIERGVERTGEGIEDATDGTWNDR